MRFNCLAYLQLSMDQLGLCSIALGEVELVQFLWTSRIEQLINHV